MIAGVDGRDVPADADAPLAVQPAFAHAGAAGVLKDRRPAVGVDVAKDHVGNQLLEARVLFHLIARPVARLLGPQQFAEIPIDLAAKPLKMPQPVKQLGGNHQDTFDLILGHDGILVGRVSETLDAWLRRLPLPSLSEAAACFNRRNIIEQPFVARPSV